MNASKLSYATDFRDGDLSRLLEAADVVIEGSRPAALARRGLAPEQVRGRPGRVWLRITGYGTEGECATAWHSVTTPRSPAVSSAAGPVFVGDAIADPLTGLAATQAVLDSLRPRRRGDRRGRLGGGRRRLRDLAAHRRSARSGERAAGAGAAEHARPTLGGDNERVRESD